MRKGVYGKTPRVSFDTSTADLLVRAGPPGPALVIEVVAKDGQEAVSGPGGPPYYY